MKLASGVPAYINAQHVSFGGDSRNGRTILYLVGGFEIEIDGAPAGLYAAIVQASAPPPSLAMRLDPQSMR